jgi:type II secretory pathway predicted ATPase ExeA
MGISSVEHLNWLGLVENPFLEYPDGRYYYPLSDHQSVYREIVEMVANKGERTVSFVRADHGMGKTLLGKRLVNAAFPESEMNAAGIYLDQTKVNTPATLLKFINEALHLDPVKSYSDRLKVLREALTRQMKERGESLFLVIDGVPGNEAVEPLGELASWEYGGNHMASIAIFSKGDIFELYGKMKTFSNRVAVTRSLSLPAVTEAARLLEHRVRFAGRAVPLFEDSALTMIASKAGRIPGKMIDLARISLEQLMTSNDMQITDNIVMNAIEVAAAENEPAEKVDLQMPLLGNAG